jgi:hypothetical protein
MTAREAFTSARREARLTGAYWMTATIAGRRIYPAHGYDVDGSVGPTSRHADLNAAAHYRRAGCKSLCRCRVERQRAVRQARARRFVPA